MFRRSHTSDLEFMTQEIITSQGDYHDYNKLVSINTLCVGLQSGLNLNESGVGIVKCE